MKIETDVPKLMYHPERVAQWKETGDCFPIYVEIGPTNRCNHRCLFCALDWLVHGGSDINAEVLNRNLVDMAQHGVKSVMFAGEGEPLLHRDITSFVKTARESGMDVSITSNGSLFDYEKAEQILPHLSWIRFSIDAGTPETYARIHGTRKEEYEKLLKNIASAVEIRNKKGYDVTIGTQALLTNLSLGELETLAVTLKEMGVDNLQIKPYSHHPLSKNDLSFDFKRAEEIRIKLEGLSGDKFQMIYRTEAIRNLCERGDYTLCHGLPFFALLDSKGDIIPCNLFYNNPEFTYGNINDNLFSQIWASQTRKDVLEKLKKRGVQDCRRGCRLDASNRYLDKVARGSIKLEAPKDPIPAHKNFI